MRHCQVKFSTYFHDWLYGQNAYYSNYKTIGKEGDFYTAVSSSKFFGGSIANRILENIENGFLAKDTTILEVGAHHGYLSADIIQFIYTANPDLLKTLSFAIIEKYDHLQEKQKVYFKESFGDTINIKHYKCIEDVKLHNAFIIANEIFDAFPCELVNTKENILEQAFVKNDTIIWEKCEDTELIQICKNNKITKGEVSLGFKWFAQSLKDNIGTFEFITFDYGDEYPRNDFSCRIYQKHNVYPIFDENIDLKQLFKKTDITYDVNFSYLMNCFKEVGIDTIIYETQLKALVRFGIIDLLEILHKNVNEKIYLSETNKVKTLLNPTGMGDRFKMAVFRKS